MTLCARTTLFPGVFDCGCGGGKADVVLVTHDREDEYLCRNCARSLARELRDVVDALFVDEARDANQQKGARS